VFHESLRSEPLIPTIRKILVMIRVAYGVMRADRRARRLLKYLHSRLCVTRNKFYMGLVFVSDLSPGKFSRSSLEMLQEN